MKVHPHALHEIMGEPKQVDPALVTPEIEAILRKTKRTDEEKALIKHLKEHTLSEGAKSAIERWVKKDIYGFCDFQGNKYTEKGLTLEDNAIRAVQIQNFIGMQKNEKTFSNEYLEGTPDILVWNKGYGRDTKCSWSGIQHPFFEREAVKKVRDNGYDYQMHGYMNLTKLKRWAVDFVLLPTPDHLIFGEDQREQQVTLINQIPLKERITTIWIEYDEEVQRLIKIKCSLAQVYAQSLKAELGKGLKVA
ncbi:hypothetical protein ABLB95_15365 (plasmid) [Acinetobacter radioresistens]|uniref:hypothetical protein n=1 Tax=Acinetobacter TaxID=469 RepID=UPI000445E8DB|nr:hypothetical protein [Acinetobacter sp. 869535]EXC34414.1 hypothetical protein J520_0306 [Acinetobacter sp. 869535]